MDLIYDLIVEVSDIAGSDEGFLAYMTRDPLLHFSHLFHFRALALIFWCQPPLIVDMMHYFLARVL